MEITYNCWHGCHKKSEGCLNCYVYRRDNSIGKDSNIISKTNNFDMPIKKDRKGNYKYEDGTTFMLCFSSDFFIEEADQWRDDVLKMIKQRDKCYFMCITKRPERIKECIKDLDTYTNLDIYCTCENQKRLDERMPIYLDLPIKHKGLMIEPMLERIDISRYIDKLDLVTVGGESGVNARVCNFDWVKEIHEVCKKAHVDFYYHQTGAKLIVDGKLYNIKRKYQHSQARKAFSIESLK